MDRRMIKTKKAIFDAFYKLIVRRAYAKISVQNIIDEANIGRSTFYEHFETKDELLMSMCTDLFEHIFAAHEKDHYAFKDCDYNEENTDNTRETLRGKFTHVLYHLLDDGRVIKGILSSESSEIFIRYFKEYLIRAIKPSYIKIDGVPENFVLNHIASSFVESIRWWVERDFKETPEQLGSYILNVLTV